ncbi:MAG: DUF5665 domain-containing protein [bacterium]|nr:DUF5665 domain-containing protein [bacterium]
MKSSSKNKPKSEKYYENLGRVVASVYETGYLDAAKSYKMSFIKGLFQGLGGAIGATLLLALLIWILSLFNDLWFIAEIIKKVEMGVNE